MIIMKLVLIMVMIIVMLRIMVLNKSQYQVIRVTMMLIRVTMNNLKLINMYDFSLNSVKATKALMKIQ